MGNDLMCCKRDISFEPQNKKMDLDISHLDEVERTPNSQINRKIMLNTKKIILIQNYFRMFKKRKEIKNILKEKPKKIEENNMDQNKSIETTLDSKVKNKKKRKKSKKNINKESITEKKIEEIKEQQETPKNENNDINENNNEANKVDNETPNNVFFDENLMPGKKIENFDEIVINPSVKKTELSLGEFIIEEKELLKYFESYPFKLKQFSIEYNNGDKYNGFYSPTWSKEGFGILIYNNGSKYEGMFKNNLAEGRGRLILTKGDYYEGEFVKDLSHGYGKYVSPEGEIYLGYWKDNKQDGLGKFIFEGKIRYGSWKLGNREKKLEENEFFNLLNEQNSSNFILHIFKADYNGLHDYIQNYNDF
jgi:hypothetical protein